MPIMFLLAVIVGYSDRAEQLIRKVAEAEDTQTCKDFLEGCELDELKAAAMPHLGILATMHVKYLKLNLPLISRFSFRTLMKHVG